MQHKEITITHVKMKHKASCGGNLLRQYQQYALISQFQYKPKKDIESVAFSQFKTAQTILANPDAIVLHEGLAQMRRIEDFDAQTISSIKQCFNPETFNSLPEELSDTQIELLYKHHGANILLCLGLINAIYPTETEIMVAFWFNYLKLSKSNQNTFKK